MVISIRHGKKINESSAGMRKGAQPFFMARARTGFEGRVLRLDKTDT